MKFSLFITVDKHEHFLQSSNELDRVRQPKMTLDRWMNEMGVPTKNLRNAKFTILENGSPILTKPYMGNGSRAWRSVLGGLPDEESRV